MRGKQCASGYELREVSPPDSPDLDRTAGERGGHTSSGVLKHRAVGSVIDNDKDVNVAERVVLFPRNATQDACADYLTLPLQCSHERHCRS
jgi:hypothetical protein